MVKVNYMYKKENVGFAYRYLIVGGRRLSNYWWSIILFLGGCGFLFTGLSSYFNRNLFFLSSYFDKEDSLPFSTISFFPQGLVLSFYGFLALWLAFHLWFALLWKIGAGFNEFGSSNSNNESEKYVRIFRWGRPGKNRRIDFKYTNGENTSIEAIKIALLPKPALFLCLKGNQNTKNIPLTSGHDFIPLEDLEAQAAELTNLLQIPLEIDK